MLPSALPRCPFCPMFVGRTFRSGGSHFGGAVNQQGFTCAGCGASVQYLTNRAGGILTFIQQSACTEPDEHGERKYPEAYSTWVNKVLLPTWRAREEALNTFKTIEWDRWIAEKFAPTFPECSEYPKGKWTFYDLPPEAQAFMRETWGEAFRAGSYLPLSPDLVEDVYPPQAPVIEGVVIMLQIANVERDAGTTVSFRDNTDMAYGDHLWASIDYAHSATLTPPEDPILRNNREFFTEVWAEVARGIEQEFPPVTETKNEYGGIEPWYTFNLKGVTFTVGWRKRVVSITVDAPNGLATEDIRTLAMTDEVTYSAYGRSRLVLPDEYEATLRASATPEQENVVAGLIASYRNTYPNGLIGRTGGYRSDCKVADQINVHAWGKAKAVEYLTTLCRTVLCTALGGAALQETA